MIRIAAALALASLLLPLAPAQAKDCIDDPATSGVSRIINVDPSEGMRFGKLQYGQTVQLRDREVVLTFDDGPLPAHTMTILDVLDRHCIKATFFAVGKMAWQAPHVLKAIQKRGHTVAVHTWSHPRSLPLLTPETAKLEIERGFAAVGNALGGPISPFFRYPGLNDSPELNAYMASRGISVWSVDVVCGDTEPNMTQEKLVAQAMSRLHAVGRGILLFHDIKKVTADSLDEIIVRLKMEGYKFAHVVSNTAYIPDPEVIAKIDGKGTRTAAFTGQPAESGTAVSSTAMAGASHVDYAHRELINLGNGRKSPARSLSPAPGSTGSRGAANNVNAINLNVAAAGQDVIPSAARPRLTTPNR